MTHWHKHFPKNECYLESAWWKGKPIWYNFLLSLSFTEVHLYMTVGTEQAPSFIILNIQSTASHSRFETKWELARFKKFCRIGKCMIFPFFVSFPGLFHLIFRNWYLILDTFYTCQYVCFIQNFSSKCWLWPEYDISIRLLSII